MRSMRTIVSKLRRKLGDDADNPAYIFTEPRIGYRMPKRETKGTRGDGGGLRSKPSLTPRGGLSSGGMGSGLSLQIQNLHLEVPLGTVVEGARPLEAVVLRGHPQPHSPSLRHRSGSVTISV